MTVAPHLDPAREPASDTEQKQIALSYVLEAWHEGLGTAQQTVTVKDGERKPVKFSFAAKN